MRREPSQDTSLAPMGALDKDRALQMGRSKDTIFAVRVHGQK